MSDEEDEASSTGFRCTRPSAFDVGVGGGGDPCPSSSSVQRRTDASEVAVKWLCAVPKYHRTLSLKLV